MGKRKERVKRLFADKKEIESRSYSKGRAAAILSVVSVLTCLLSVGGYLLIRARFGDANVLKEWAWEHPVLGVLLMILVTAVQVVVAFIPGELVEVAAGVIFGAFWGTVISLGGILLGSVTAICLARRFGRGLVEALYPREKLDSLPVLSEPSKRNAMTALLFLIPGTPKDLLTYIIGLTDMSIPLYILLTAVCRLPSVVSSTMTGAALGDNRFLLALYILIGTGVVSGIGYLIYLRIHKKSRSGDGKK